MKILLTTLLLLILSQSAMAALLEYEIYSISDDGTATIIAGGKKEYSPSDILVKQRTAQDETSWQKSVPLEKGFVVGASIYREQNLKGFGLWAENDAPRSFSWEWFDYVQPGVYKKLQEGGEVKVVYQGMPLVQEIAEIHFITDVSFRIKNTYKVDYRVLIKKGSVLKFKP